MNCFVCSKTKEDFEVWHNKIVIGATYDSEFQNNENIRKMDDKAVICHNCVEKILIEINKNKK